MPRDIQAAAALNWHEVRLKGQTSNEYAEQIEELAATLAFGWQTKPSPKTGNPVYVRPSVLVVYREDHKFLLDRVIPKPGQTFESYDLIVASQPWRARMSAKFKAEKVLAPLSRSLAPNGRLLVIQSYGHDPALEIIQRLWPDENPFQVDRRQLIAALKAELGREAGDFNLAVPRRRQVHLPLRDAHAADRDRRPHRHLDAVRRVERGHLREPDRGGAARRGGDTRAPTSTRPRTCCRSTGASGSTTRPSSSRGGRSSRVRREPQGARRGASPRAPRSRSPRPTARCRRRSSGRLPAGTTLYVAHTPNTTLADVAEVACAAERAGFRGCPHLVARRIASRAELDAALARLKAGGVSRALLVAGDQSPPAGEFASTLEILESGALDRGGNHLDRRRGSPAKATRTFRQTRSGTRSRASRPRAHAPALACTS